MKYYYRTTEELICWPLSHHIDCAKSEGLTEVTLYEAIPEKMDGFFFCQHYSEVGEAGNCGKKCEGYKPRNGKSGRCRYHDNRGFTQGEIKTFKVK